MHSQELGVANENETRRTIYDRFNLLTRVRQAVVSYVAKIFCTKVNFLRGNFRSKFGSNYFVCCTPIRSYRQFGISIHCIGLGAVLIWFLFVADFSFLILF